jgi:predicted SnoaL-like aldol condensation-catalyzing enzyme
MLAPSFADDASSHETAAYARRGTKIASTISDQYFAPDFKANSNDPSGAPGLAGAKTAHAAMNRRTSDRNVQIVELIEEGDKVVLRNRARKAHRRGVDGRAGGREDHDIESWSIYRLRDGKIVEHWGLNDGMRLMMQIGGQLPQPTASSR